MLTSSFALLNARASRLNFSLILLLAGMLTVIHPGRVYAQCTANATLSSADNIETTANTTGSLAEANSPYYPSTITTSGLSGSVCGVTLTLNGVNANGSNGSVFGLNGAEILLVSPDGDMLQFMGSVGPAGPSDYVTGLNMTFEDSASTYLPGPNGTLSQTSGSGSWKPSSYDLQNGQTAPIPFPIVGNVPSADLPSSDGSATLTSVFTGATANGAWKLYLINFDGDVVQISGGWSLTISTLASSISSTTSLSSTTNPAYNAGANDTVTFTATVSAAGGTPTGTVTFTNNGVALTCTGGNPAAVSSGEATCTTTFSAGTCESATGSQGSSVCQGDNTITATYSGSGNVVGSHGSLDEVIEAHSTNPGGTTYCNESPLYMPGDGTPQAYPSIINVTGVSASEVSNVSVQLNNMNGDAPTNQYLLVSPDGSHNLDFLDLAFTQTNSSGVNLIMEDLGTLLSGNSTASSGTYAPYDDNSNPDGFPAAGSISGVPQVPGTVVDAEPKGNVTNTFETEFNGATSNGNWALYALDNENSAGGYVGNWCITLTPAAANNSATTLTTNVADQYTGQPVTLTATVKDGATLITSGTVTFLDNGAVPAGTTSGDNVVQLGSNGQATFTTSSLTQGDHPFTANYGGDATYNPSEGTVVQRIDNASVATSPASNQYQFCNTGAVESTTGAKGAFTPNPSNVFVTNLPGTVSSVNVTLNGFFTDSTETLDETEALLQGPNGTAGNNLDFFSNTGNLNETLTNATLTFSDSASGNVPAGSGWGSGTYKPTAEDNINSDADQFFSSSSSLFNAPTNISYADPRGSSTLGSEFAGANGNGTYSLFFNVLGEDSEEGAAGGWCADFTENPVTVTPTVSHSGSGEGGDFVGGETNAAITADIAVASNGGPTGDPLGTNPLTVIDTLNSNLTYSSSTGTGWTCSASTQVVTCTNDSAVAQNSTYPTLTIDVNVAASPTAGSITNKMSLSGAGITATSSNTDTIAIDTPPAITSGASTTFTVGTAGSFTVTATGSPAPTFSEIGDLPSGVTFSSGGVLSGTPAAGTGGSYPIVITASNGASPNAIQSFTLTVDQAPAITSGASTTFAVGTAGSFTVVGGGYPAPTFSETGSLPSGVTLSTGGVLSGTPAAGTGGSYPIVITASNGVGTSATQDFTLTVDQAPAITSGASATFTAGTAGSFTVTATGSPAPTFSETGSLPSGVTLSTGGVLSGTPAAGTGGSYPITITASNGASPNATQNFTLTVDQAPAITSGASTTFAVGTAGSFTVTGTGYPAPTFSETGSLPSGVTLSTGGVLSGTPAAGTGGSYPITITASNGASPNAIQSFTLTVDQAPTITSANSTSFQVGAAGTFPVIASGYPIPAFTITAGTLPTGVTLVDNGNGTATLSGTPALGTNGSYPITIQAANGIGSPGDQSFTLTVNGASILVVDVSTDDAGSAGNCAVQTSPTQNTGNTSCSLRDALAESQTLGAASIYFYPGAFTSPTTITETNGTLAIPANTEIFGLTSGTGTNRITVKGASGSVFSLSSGLTGSLANLNITGGSAAPGSGGGIESNGTLTVMACTIYNNSAFSGGGIMNNGSLAVADSTFYNNSASSGGGGGIMNYFTATLTVASSTFYNNSANSSIGGAIDSIAGAGAATVTGSTISGNSANDGGGISAGSTFTISNSIVAGNTASADADGTGNFTDAGNNLIGDGTGWSGISNGSNGNQVGTTATPINPELAPLANYGGPTQTMIPLPGSAAICAGSASTAANADLTSDQRGEAMSLTTGNASSYTGLGGYCPAGSVDAGAVQTNYSLSFSTEPQPITPATTIYQNTNFEAGVTLDESGTPFTAAGETIPLTLTGTGTLSGGSATTSTSTGIASYSTLQVSSAGTGDQLTATLALNPAILSASPAVSATSSSFDVAATSAPTITSANTATFTVSTVGTFTVTTSGAPTASLSETGALPSGLTFTDNGNGTATLAGTPAAGTGGSYPISITADNGTSPNGTQSFTLTVDQPSAITSAAAATFTVGTAGSFNVTATGDPAPTFTETGTLPSGVTLAANGALSGTPAAGTGGSYSITITASNGVGTNATQNFTLTVDQPPAITSAAATSFTAGTAGSFNVTASGYPAPTFTETGALPSGVTLSSNGTLSGTPAAGTGGSYAIIITASNGVGTNATQNFTLTVDQVSAITSTSSTTFTTGASGSFTVTTTGNPKPSLSENGALPTGVTFTDNGNGTATFAGVPALGTGGSYSITITASNGIGSNATQNFTLTVDQAPAITSANSTSFTAGAPETFTIATTAYPTSALSESGALPSGVTFTDNGNGTATLAGTPAQGTENTYSLTVMAGNGISPGATQRFTLTVVPPPAFVVTVTTDDVSGTASNCTSGGLDCSLRDALAASVAVGGQIAFSPTVFATAQTIALNSTLNIPSNTIITGSAAGITVSGGGSRSNFTVMSVASGVTNAAINSLTIANGYAASGYAGILNAGALTITDCTIAGNVAQGNSPGGGIYNQGTLALINSTVSGNTAGVGGGIYNDAGVLSVSNSTISTNSSTAGGGSGIYSNGGGTTIANSIVAGNTGGDCNAGACPANGSNGNVIGVTANLAALANFGGATESMLPLPGSAAICAGLQPSIPSGITTDQRGYTRTTSYNGTPCVDAGAVQTNYSIAFVQQPSTVIQNAVMAPSPTVLLDESGTAFTGSAITIPLTLTTGSGSLTGGSASTSTATGIATYSGLSISLPGISDQLTATLSLNPSLTTPLSVSLASDTFNVNSAVTQLAFSNPPPLTLAAGGNAGSSIVVHEEDVNGALVTTASDTITLTVTGPNSYAKTYTQTASAGAVSFDLSAAPLTASGVYSYTASISSSSVTDAMASETVGSAVAASLSVVSGSGQSAVIGGAFAQPLKVLVEDQYSNPVSGAAVVFTGPASGAGATFSASVATATDGTTSVTATANGTASTSAYTVQASVTGATTAANFSLTNTHAATTLTVAPSATALVYGQPVTVNASISPSSVLTSVPTGSVTFYDGATALTPASTVSSAAASYVISVPAVGSHSYAAHYGGDTNFKQSALTSAPAALVVSKAGSTLTSPTSPINLTYGAGGTISISVAGQYSGAGIAQPTGNVNYTFGSGPVQTAAIAAGVATLTIPEPQGAASYTLAVSYNGDGNYNAATPIDVKLNVNQAAATISVTPYSVPYDGAAHTATGTATGLGGVNLSADLTLSATTHTVAGTYATDAWSFHDPAGNYANASGTVSDTISEATLILTANNSTKVYGAANPVFSGTVTGQQNGDKFTESFSTTATLSSPVNTYAIVPSVTGADVSDYALAVNNGTLTVTKAATNTTLGLSTANITPGQNETLAAQVLSSTSGTPTGTVSFYDGTTLLGTVTMSAGAASYSTTGLAPGVSHSLSAVYNGDLDFNGSSTATSATVVVAPLDFTMTLAGPSTLTVDPDQSVSYKLQVKPDYGSYPGTVNFTIKGLPPGATATFSPASIAASGGPQTITVTILTAPSTSVLDREQPLSGGQKLAPLAFAFLLLFGVGSMRKRGRALFRLLCVAVLLAGGAVATLTLSGCGSASYFGSGPADYTLTVTANAGSLEHTAAVILTVQ